ncbi:MAG TPA: protein kinase [Kofleriaceae bacterium]|nr:protein kinase [Kofleriaceae bacterium]
MGKVILSFRIEQKLAEGGMGAVYLARHEELAHTLKVIKVLLPEHAAEPTLRGRFRREAEAASRLKHDKILGVDNFGTLEDGQLFMMVPFLEGEPLDAFLHRRGGRLAPHCVLHLAVQICDALDYAHGRGVIHRDLKLGNVFVVSTNDNPYVPKLLDFGIAKVIGACELGPRTQSGRALGTPGYMAIEQYACADEVTPAADVYSLAVVIWELVTGRRPWKPADCALLYLRQRTVLPARPPAGVMPEAWADILLRAMSIDPRARPSARELAVALASALPAVGPIPSGAEILAALAPHFVRGAAHDDETIHNASEVDRIGPLLWPPRDTEAPAARPAGMASATMCAAADAVTSPRTERLAGWRLVLAAVGAAGVAAVATGALASRAKAGGSSSARPQPDDAGERASDADARARPRAGEAMPGTPVNPRELPETMPAVTASPRAPAAKARRVTDPAPAHDPAHQLDGATPSAADRSVEAEETEEPVQSVQPVQIDTSIPPKPILADPDDVLGPEM